MTPPQNHSERRRTRRGGFSLVELLVVIGVIIVLVGITVAVVGKARRAGNTARIKADLIAISTAIDQFKADHKGLPGMVPNVPPNLDTHNALAYCLVSPEAAAQDGVDGPGFRVGGPQTKAWPPYLDASKFNVRFKPTLPDGAQVDRGEFKWELLDAFGMPIAYLPRRKPGVRPNVGILANYGGSNPGSFNANDVDGLLTSPPLSADARKGLLIALGDRNANNKIDGDETMNFGGDYILMSAGFDVEFFVGDTYQAFQKSDDVYNFDR